MKTALKADSSSHPNEVGRDIVYGRPSASNDPEVKRSRTGLLSLGPGLGHEVPGGCS